MDRTAKIITISSGKGGVGKTCTSVNLSILLAQQGFRVCLFDADANLANVNIMLKFTPEYTLEHVISGQKPLKDIILHKAGIDVIPGASGLSDFVSLAPRQQQRLQATMRQLKTNYDFLIIDNPAGISENVLSYIKFSDFSIVIITPEPTSLTDAFALIRVCQRRKIHKPINVIVNHVYDKTFADKIFHRFSAAVLKHIGQHVSYLGWVIDDQQIAKAVCLQNPVVLQYPTSPSVQYFTEISQQLLTLQKTNSINNKPQLTTANTKQNQSPDFSAIPESINNKIEVQKPVEIKQPAKELSAEELASGLQKLIEDKNNNKEQIKNIMQQLNNTYSKRFGDYAVDLSQVLRDAITKDHISQNTLQHLVMTLHGLHQDYYGVPINIEPAHSEPEPNEVALNQESVDLLINLLRENIQLKPALSNMHTLVPADNERPKLVTTDDSEKEKQDIDQGLIDSIRYAAMLDK